MTNAERSKEWRRLNPEKVRAAKRADYAKNKTKILASRKEYSKSPRVKAMKHKNSLRFHFGEAAEGVRPRPELCELCNRPNPQKGRGLHFDHCHTTGKFRGWLCSHCNAALGQCDDNPAILRALADYLEK